jgi:hypothetical protein
MAKAKAIAAFFRTRPEGESAREALYQAGYSTDEVSYLAGDTSGHETPKVGPPVRDSGTQSEAGADAFVGGVVGLAAGAVLSVIPGIGPLLAIGPIAGAIGGLTAGVTAGGIIGLLKDHGISEEKAEFYAEGVRRGGALITIHGVNEEREKEARKILDEAGAMEVEQLADEWRSTGWTGPNPKVLRAR